MRAWRASRMADLLLWLSSAADPIALWVSFGAVFALDCWLISRGARG